MNIDKKVEKILSKPTEMRFDDIQQIFEYFGFSLEKFKGSHAYFYNETTRKFFFVPTINGRMVKNWYLNEICKFLELKDWFRNEK